MLRSAYTSLKAENISGTGAYMAGPASAAAAVGAANTAGGAAGDELMGRQVNHSPVSPVSKLAPLSEQSGKYGALSAGPQSGRAVAQGGGNPFPVVTA